MNPSTFQQQQWMVDTSTCEGITRTISMWIIPALHYYLLDCRLVSDWVITKMIPHVAKLLMGSVW